MKKTMLKYHSIKDILRSFKGEHAQNQSYSITTIRGTDYFFTNPHRGFFFGLSIIISGSASFTLNLRECTAKAGHLLGVAPGSILSFQHTDPDFIALTLFFNDDFLSEVINDSTFLFNIPIFQFGTDPVLEISEAECEKITALLNTIGLYYRDYKSDNLKTIKHIILAILTDLKYICSKKQRNGVLSINSRQTDIANQYLQLVSQHYMQKRNISDYAKQLTISTKHLSETLKEVTGRPATFWIDLMIMQEAQILLRQTNSTISQISQTLGFSDQSAFGKFFKHNMKISAGSYRKSLR